MQGHLPSLDEFRVLWREAPDYFVTVLYESCGIRIMGCIRRASRFPLTADECEEILQETMRAVIEQVRAGRFAPLDPLTWSCAIAHNKAIDYVRRECGRRHALEGLADLLPTAEPHAANVEISEIIEIIENIRELILDRLTGVEKAAAVALERNYERNGPKDKYARLAAAMGGTLHRSVSVTSAKHALVRVLKKVQALLMRLGQSARGQWPEAWIVLTLRQIDKDFGVLIRGSQSLASESTVREVVAGRIVTYFPEMEVFYHGRT